MKIIYSLIAASVSMAITSAHLSNAFGQDSEEQNSETPIEVIQRLDAPYINWQTLTPTAKSIASEIPESEYLQVGDRGRVVKESESDQVYFISKSGIERNLKLVHLKAITRTKTDLIYTDDAEAFKRMGLPDNTLLVIRNGFEGLRAFVFTSKNTIIGHIVNPIVAPTMYLKCAGCNKWKDKKPITEDCTTCKNCFGKTSGRRDPNEARNNNLRTPGAVGIRPGTDGRAARQGHNGLR